MKDGPLSRMVGTPARLLLVLGVGCLVWYGAVWLEGRIYQSLQRAALDRVLAARPAPGPSQAEMSQAETEEGSEPGQPIGRLEIPRVHLSVMVVNGDDDQTLGLAVGHLPDTPFPWQPGNSAFAGHRDTYFRPLENIQLDDEVRLVTTHGTYRYRVRRTLIVDPADVWVLAPAAQSTLTLVTCYPFRYVGPAPRRFVVQADRIVG
jgi:sortase A